VADTLPCLRSSSVLPSQRVIVSGHFSRFGMHRQLKSIGEQRLQHQPHIPAPMAPAPRLWLRCCTVLLRIHAGPPMISRSFNAVCRCDKSPLVSLRPR